jgi:hypothetical protein
LQILNRSRPLRQTGQPPQRGPLQSPEGDQCDQRRSEEPFPQSASLRRRKRRLVQAREDPHLRWYRTGEQPLAQPHAAAWHNRTIAQIPELVSTPLSLPCICFIFVLLLKLVGSYQSR